MTEIARLPQEQLAPWVAEARHAVAHACARISAAALQRDPMPHIYVTDVFPADFYAAMLRHFPTPAHFKSMRNSFHGNEEISAQRYYLSHFDGDHQHLPPEHAAFWQAFFSALSEAGFARTTARKFLPYLDLPRRMLLGNHHDLLLINDHTGYDIGPHTDTPAKQYSLLFYCPPDDASPELGTSAFRRQGHAPRQAKRTDAWLRRGGDPALDFNDFDPLFTAPYVPNALFGFVRTRYSYHGVKPTQSETPRQLLIYENFSMRPSRMLRAQRKP